MARTVNPQHTQALMDLLTQAQAAWIGVLGCAAF